MYAIEKSSRIESRNSRTYMPKRRYRFNFQKRNPGNHIPKQIHIGLDKRKQSLPHNNSKQQEPTCNKQSLYDGFANNLALPSLVNVPYRIITKNSDFKETQTHQLQLLKLIGTGFNCDIKYKRHESLEEIIENNLKEQVNNIFQFSSGWQRGSNPIKLFFEIGSAEDLINSEIELENYEESYILCDYSGPSDYFIEKGINALEKVTSGLGQTALSLLIKTPMDLYTPNEMFDDISMMEWLGEDDEKERIKELIADGEDLNDIDVITRTEVNKNFKKRELFPLYNEALIELPNTPKVIKNLNKAIEVFNKKEHSLPYLPGRLPCALLLFGNKNAQDIMRQTINYRGDILFQTGEDIFQSGFLLEFKKENASKTIDKLKAYFDCVYWTGELLKYLTQKG